MDQLPDLQAAVEAAGLGAFWPRLVPHWAAAALPAAGWLFFFYDAQEQPWGSTPADRGRAVVLYQPAATVLTPRPLPAELSTEAYTAFPVSPLLFAAETTLPNPWEDDIDIAENEMTEDQRASAGRSGVPPSREAPTGSGSAGAACGSTRMLGRQCGTSRGQNAPSPAASTAAFKSGSWSIEN
ncbi:MAG: hypothetical protein EOO56_30150 [Hymenobacter sp.]|nr:MAG: hypothetical protein EOO56_30150 [Hymenobacter sp.]